jgi:D-alanine-D-alanine ligase
MKRTVLILCGGRSDEHEISLISAKCVLDALDRTKYHPLLVGISRDGTWYLEQEDTFFTGEFRADRIQLNPNAPTVTLAPFRTAEGRAYLEAGERRHEFDVVFPILHGPYGEDGTMQGLLEIVGVPYVGSGCGSSWICMDKALAKTLCQQHGIRVADYVLVTSLTDYHARKAQIEDLGETIFVKPARLGSSVGISKVVGGKGLDQAVGMALKYDSKVLLERAISGREIETAVLGLNRTARVALPGEIIPDPKIGWYSYEAKYLLSEGAEVVVPAALGKAKIEEVQAFALKVFRVLECDGMARIDLFMDKKSEELYLNEANTIPGFTPISMYPKMWQASGLSYSALISELIELGIQRLSFSQKPN